MATPESKTKKEIRAYLKEQGAYFFAPVQTGYGQTTLDFLVCLRGSFVGIECKAPMGRMTPRQGVVIGDIRRAGGRAFVARSVSDVIAALAKPEILTTKAF